MWTFLLDRVDGLVRERDCGGGGGLRLVLVGGGAADELDAREDVDAAGQQHGEALDAHAAVGAGGGGRPVPGVEVPAARLVVHVVEETVLGHEQRVALERAGCTRHNMHSR